MTDQPVQEPLAWLYPEGLEALQNGKCWTAYPRSHEDCNIPLYIATPPLPVQEPVACRFCHSEKGCWTWQCYHCGEIDDVQKPAPPPVQEPVTWDKPSASFNEWWNGDYEDPANPFEKDSHGYWAWEGWQAALRSKNT